MAVVTEIMHGFLKFIQNSFKIINKAINDTFKNYNLINLIYRVSVLIWTLIRVTIKKYKNYLYWKFDEGPH